MEMFQRWYATQRKRLESNGFAQLNADMHSIQFVDISNAATYFYDHEKEYWDFELDFPALALPWPRAWMEFKGSSQFNEEMARVTASPSDVYYGTIATALEIDPADSENAIRMDWGTRMIKQAIQRLPNPPQIAEARLQRAAKIRPVLERGTIVRWIQVFNTWVSASRNGPLIPIALHVLYLTPLGQTIPELYTVLPFDRMVRMEAGVPVASGSDILPYCYALSLLHCKNVELVDAAFHRKTKRYWSKKHSPDIVFKQLTVHPMRSRKVYTDGAEQLPTGQTRRLHICRGHFKDYRSGKGLFGRYKRLFWWSQQLRGSIDEGLIVKDYNIQMDANGETPCLVQ